MNDTYGSSFREALKHSMEHPARKAHYWPRQTSFAERHREAIITTIVILTILAILWADVHLFAVAL